MGSEKRGGAEGRARRAGVGRHGRPVNRVLNAVVAVVLVAIVAGSYAGIAAWGATTHGAEAVIRDETGREQRLPLDTDAELTVKTRSGWNKIVIEDGTVRIAEANCKHRDCVEKGAISQVGEQIVCLPHKLIVSVSEEGETAEFDVIGS